MRLSRLILSRKYAAVAVIAVAVCAAAWKFEAAHREIEFRNSFAPLGHYRHAVWLSKRRSGVRPSVSDLTAAIHHLEVIPEGTPVHAQAADLLPVLRVWRDRPQDFPAAEEASFRSCMARADAETKTEEQKRPCPGFLAPDGKCLILRCGVGLVEECAPLATGGRLTRYLQMSMEAQY